MSLYRCLNCGGKSDDSDDFIYISKKQAKILAKKLIIHYSGWDIEGSNYEWLICNDCFVLLKTDSVLK